MTNHSKPKSRDQNHSIEDCSSIAELRNKIDSIDQDLLRLLDKRAQIVKRVGELKKLQNLKIHDPHREKEILEKIIKAPHPHLFDSEVKTFFQSLISFFRTTESAHTARSSVSPLPPTIKFGFFGFGLMGGSIGLALARQFPSSCFLIVDPNINSETLTQWSKDHHLNNFKLVTEENLKGCDFVFLGAPISVNESKAESLSRDNKLLLNLGSVLDSDLPQTCGFHPLAGKEQSGYGVAQEDLFFGKTICITPTENISNESLQQIKDLALALGAQVWIGSVETHNQALAYTSHLIQILSMALGECYESMHLEKNLALIPQNAAQLLRLTGSNKEMWSSIFEKNGTHINQAIEDLKSKLSEFQRALQQSSREPHVKVGEDHTPYSRESSPPKNGSIQETKPKNEVEIKFEKSHLIYKKFYQKGNLP